MFELDCESKGSTLKSLSQIYGVPEKEIDVFLHESDLDNTCPILVEKHPPDRVLTILFERAFQCTPAVIDRVFWFHLTRASHNIDFSAGLLPLPEALPVIWNAILDAFGGTPHEKNLREMSKSGVPDFQYKLKAGNSTDGGPYAMLVKDTASKSQEMRNHDYLHLPEIVEDICSGYSERYGECIHHIVSEAWVPYIVKFWSRKRTGKDCLEAALFYLYCTAHRQDLSLFANTCFDGENQRITREQIVRVEPVMGFSP